MSFWGVQGSCTTVFTLRHSIRSWSGWCFGRSPAGGNGLQYDTAMKQKYMDVGIPDFYKFLPWKKFPKLVSAAARIMAMLLFGAVHIYVCEQFFSSIKINKSVLRSRLTDKHLRATLRLATTHDFRLNVDSLVSAKRSQLSGQSSSEE